MLNRMRTLCLGHWSEEPARAQFLERWLQFKQSQGWPVSKQTVLVVHHMIGDQWLYPGVVAPFIGLINVAVRSLWCKLRGVAMYWPYEVICTADVAQAKALLGISTAHIAVVSSVTALEVTIAQIQHEIAMFHPDPKLVSYVVCLDGDDVLFIKLGQSSPEPTRTPFAAFVAQLEQELR